MPKAGGGICIYGFCAEDADPLRDALGKDYSINRRTNRSNAELRLVERPPISALRQLSTIL